MVQRGGQASPGVLYQDTLILDTLILVFIPRPLQDIAPRQVERASGGDTPRGSAYDKKMKLGDEGTTTCGEFVRSKALQGSPPYPGCTHSPPPPVVSPCLPQHAREGPLLEESILIGRGSAALDLRRAKIFP